MTLKIAIVLALVVTITHGLVWEENEDTIGIDGRTESDITEEEFETNEESTTISGNTDTCVYRGLRGKCITFEECYPYVQKSQRDANDTDSDEIYPTAPCDPSNGAIICCPSYGYATLRKIIKPAQTPNNASNIPTIPTVPPINAPGDLKQVGDCGKLRYPIEPAVVGGREAQAGEFPYIVAIAYKNRHHCGGSIIDTTTILTAAHCVARGLEDVNQIRILAGSHTSPSGGTVMKVAKMYYNKNFNQNVLGSDTAIIKLTQPLVYSDLIQPVCLSKEKTIPALARAELAGWGLTADPMKHKGTKPSPVLRTVRMDFLTNADCKKKYQGQQVPPIRESHICATGSTAGSLKDSCYGDSGGPLTIVDKGRAEQVGVVSWGLGCGSFPGVYERTAFYVDWIAKTSKL